MNDQQNQNEAADGGSALTAELGDDVPCSPELDYHERKRLMFENEMLRDALQTVVDAWTAQFERNGHMAPEWVKKVRAALLPTKAA